MVKTFKIFFFCLAITFDGCNWNHGSQNMEQSVWSHFAGKC